MRKLKLLGLLLVGLQTSCLQLAQESKEQNNSYQQERQEIIDEMMKKTPGLQDGFAFLQLQGYQNESLYNFFEHVVPQCESDGENEELDLDAVIDQAEDVLTASMKHSFLQTLETAMTDHKNLDQFNDPMFLYVMQHKDDFMHGMVKVWLYEWSNTNINFNIALFVPEPPLIQASRINNTEIAKLLIDAGANVNIQIDYFGAMPLHCAALNSSIDVARMLIDAQANVNFQNKDGETPLHWAARGRKPYEVNSKKKKETVQLLIDKGADVNVVDIIDLTPLDIAFDYDNEDAAQLLINAGAVLTRYLNNKKRWSENSPKVSALLKQLQQNREFKSQFRTAQLQQQCTIS